MPGLERGAVSLAPGIRRRAGQDLIGHPGRRSRRRRHRAREREQRADTGEVARDRMRLVLLDDRHLGPDAEEPADGIQLDDEVVTQLHPVLRHELLDGGVLAGGEDRRIGHHEELAAAGDVGVEGLELRWKELGARAGDHDDGRVLRHLALTGEHERLHVVVDLLHGRLRFTEAGPLRRRQLALAVPLHDVHGALAFARQLEEAVRDLLLLGIGDLLRARLGFQHHRAVGLHPVAPGQRRLAIRVDHAPRELVAAEARVLLEEIFGHALARLVAAKERHRVDLGLEPAEELDGLGREAVSPVLGQVHARVVTEGDRLDEPDDGQQQHHHDRGVQAVPGRAAAEGATHRPRIDEKRGQHQDDADDDQGPANALPFRTPEREHDGGHEQRDAHVAQPVEDALHPFQRRASRERSVRNSATIVKST